MQYRVPIDGFEVNQVTIKTAGFFSGPKLLLNDQPAPKGSKRGQFVLQRDDGVEVTAKLKGTFLDPVPQVVIDDDVIKVVETLPWYQWIWAGLPILLIFVGGFIGAIFGVIATSVSVRVFRSEIGTIGQYVLVAVISGAATLFYLIIAVIIATLL